MLLVPRLPDGVCTNGQWMFGGCVSSRLSVCAVGLFDGWRHYGFLLFLILFATTNLFAVSVSEVVYLCLKDVLLLLGRFSFVASRTSCCSAGIFIPLRGFYLVSEQIDVSRFLGKFIFQRLMRCIVNPFAHCLAIYCNASLPGACFTAILIAVCLCHESGALFSGMLLYVA